MHVGNLANGTKVTEDQLISNDKAAEPGYRAINARFAQTQTGQTGGMKRGTSLGM